MMGKSKGLTGDLRIKPIDIKKEKKPMKKFLALGMIIIMLIVSVGVLNIQIPKEKTIEEGSDELVRRVDAKVGIVCSSDTDASFGGGAYPIDATAAARMFEYAGSTVQFIDVDDVVQGRLTSENFDIIYFGGGNAYYYKTEFQGHESIIRSFVNGGGAYMGACAGAYLASNEIIWEGSTYDYWFDLFDGYGIGSITDISDYPDPYALCHIKAVDSDFSWNGNGYDVQYYWGPYFEQYGGTSQIIDVVAEYDYTGGIADGKPAMIKFDYGSGKVFLSGPHPEFDESSTGLAGDANDWSFSDDYDDNGNLMNDPETEYGMMADIIAWAAPTKVKYEKKSDIDRAAPPSTPYRAAVYAGLGASSRCVYATMKMLAYNGITPYGWDEYGNDKITIDRFDLVVFPNGNENVMDGHVDDATIDTFVSNGGDIIGIGGGADMVWNDLGYDIGGVSDDLTPPAQDGLEDITVINSGSYNGDYKIAYWEDGSGGSSADDWDSGVSYDPISWTGDNSYTVGYFTDEGSSYYAMLKYTNPSGDGTNAQVFVSSVDPSTEEGASRDAALWDDDDFDDTTSPAESEWDLMGSILDWMGFTVIPEFTEILVPLTGMVFIAAIFSLKRKKEEE